MVSLPERRRSSSPLARVRFSSTTGALSPTFFGPTGRPASARAAIAWAAVGSTGCSAGGVAGGRRLGALGGAGGVVGLLGSGRGGALLLDLEFLGAALGRFLVGAQPGEFGLAGLRRLLLLELALGFLRLGGLDRLQPALELGVGEARRRAAGASGLGSGRGAGLGDEDPLALVLDRDRLGPAVAEALAHVAGFGAARAKPERLAALAVAVLGIHHSV